MRPQGLIRHQFNGRLIAQAGRLHGILPDITAMSFVVPQHSNRKGAKD
jgi:hypothetical protein